MTDLITAGKLCKEEREKRGLSRKDVHNITKIPVDIIRRLEEDENYLSKDPYAPFLMKVLINFYQLEIDLSAEPKQKSEKPLPQQEEEKQNIFIRFFKTVFMASVFLGFFVINTSDTDRKQDVNSFLYIINILPQEKDKNSSQLEKEEKRPEILDVSLRAKDYVWLTAYVDGKEKVLHLKKGQKIKISFSKKIRFETIGNADNLVIIFNNKKVAFERKVVHNLFVDSEGVFFNGYNLAKEES